MDVRKIFREISQKMSSDFRSSEEIKHSGSKGLFRENALKDFLQNGRLPKRYAIGSGEIVGPNSDISKQSDLIIYDALEGIPLLYSETVQVFPIDCVYGIVEVKSKLSKNKLMESLENIKSVKELSPALLQKKEMPIPFGAIFAYSLSSNSLKSLVANLRDWESKLSPALWPNLISILSEGIIYHTNNEHDKCIHGHEITNYTSPIYVAYQNDTLFHFYSSLLDLCSGIRFSSVKILKYLDLPQKMGRYFVSHNTRFLRLEDGSFDTKAVYRLNIHFIEKIVTWCKKAGPITEREMLLRVFGQIPIGTKKESLEEVLYFYNPDDLIGMQGQDFSNIFLKDNKGRIKTKIPLCVPLNLIIVNNEVYYFPQAYVTDNDIEIIPGKKFDDL